MPASTPHGMTVEVRFPGVETALVSLTKGLRNEFEKVE